jgi:hypothetical protein
MITEYTGLKHPVQNYPYRQPLALVAYMARYIVDKTVCDIGCGCGDILAEMSRYAESIIGVEIDTRFRDELARRDIERDFIIWGDVLELDLPQCDVYYLWISSDPALNHKIADMLPNGSILVDATTRLNLFDDVDCLELLESIFYAYDERVDGDDSPADRLFPRKGINRLRIYRKLNQ